MCSCLSDTSKVSPVLAQLCRGAVFLSRSSPPASWHPYFFLQAARHQVGSDSLCSHAAWHIQALYIHRYNYALSAEITD